MNKEATKDSVKATGQAGGKQRMTATTVRFPEDAAAIIRGVADEHGCSAAELIRIATCGNISKYLGNLYYVDAVQGTRIDETLRGILSEMEQIRRELHRIGINFNQKLKLEHIERKMRGTSSSTLRMNYMREQREIEKDGNLLNKEELDGIMRRFEAAAGKAGNGLWHILR